MVHSGLAFAGVLLVMIATFTLIYFHIHPKCSEEIIGESVSPNKQWVATTLQRRCGDEASFATHVNLRSAHRSITYGFFSGKAEDGKIFSAEQDAQALHLTVVWDLPDHLTIRCRDCADASTRQARWNGVTIQYQSAK